MQVSILSAHGRALKRGVQPYDALRNPTVSILSAHGRALKHGNVYRLRSLVDEKFQYFRLTVEH